ncbi:MAG: DUF3488 domain-containing protein [Armatimonadetes bacterium]|nr:DUF3488 domain-containing protein [Armatimonadota bacterium]
MDLRQWFQDQGPEEPGDTPWVRLTVLGTVLAGVLIVSLQEDFREVGLASATAIAAGYWVSWRRRRAPSRWLRLVLSLVLIAGFLRFLQALQDTVYDPRIPLVHLFLWLQVVHSFDLPRLKDLRYSLLSALTFMAVAAAFAREGTFGLTLVLFGGAATVALVALHLAAAGQRPSPRWAGRWAARVGVWVVLAGAALFVLTPRPAGLRVYWLPVSTRLPMPPRFAGQIINPAYPPGAQNALQTASAAPSTVYNPRGYFGFSSQVDLRVRGRLTHHLVMRVRATRPALWRGLAFDEYTGVGWQMRDDAVRYFSTMSEAITPFYPIHERGAAGPDVVQTFYVESAQPNVIFGAYLPREVYYPTSTIAVDGYAGLRSPYALQPGMVYSVVSQPNAPPPAALQVAAGPIPREIADRYLRLPAVPARVRDLARQITADQPTAYDKVMAVNRFLWANYAYDLNIPPQAHSGDAVDYFLFEVRRGYCEFFASAMAVMLRAVGIPARFVTGYTPGSYNIITGYYEVHNTDAHAWVEVFFPGVGWVEFEPTPTFETPVALVSSGAGRWPVLDLAHSVGAWVGGVPRPSLALPDGAGTAAAAAPGALGALGVLVFRALRRRRREPEIPRIGQEVYDIYTRMCARLARHGWTRGPAQTAGEFAALVVPRFPEVAPVTDAFCHVRYGRAAPPAEDVARLRDLVVSLERRLAAAGSSAAGHPPAAPVALSPNGRRRPGLPP